MIKVLETLNPKERKEVETYFATGKDISIELYDKLFNIYLPEMPYGTAKARTGDPYEFIYTELNAEISACDTAYESGNALF